MAGTPISTTLDCPSCRGDRLVVMAVTPADPRLLLVCPACGVAFWDPALADPVRAEVLGGSLHPATAAEARRAGWAAWLHLGR
jgi:hypothetical protein